MVRDMTAGSPMKLIAGFAVPIFLGNLLQQLYSVADAMVLGQALGWDGAAWATVLAQSVVNDLGSVTAAAYTAGSKLMNLALQSLGNTVVPMISGGVELGMRVGTVLVLDRCFRMDFYAVRWAEVTA